MEPETKNNDINLVKTLNENSKILERRIESEIKESRQQLKSIYSAVQASALGEIGCADFRLQQFLRLKGDTRAILSYYRDFVMTNHPTESSSAFLDFDRDMVTLEGSFDGQTPEQQSRQYLELSVIHDTILFRTCGTLLEKVGFDQSLAGAGLDGEDPTPTSHLVTSQCSKEITSLFRVLSTFQVMESSLRKLLRSAKPVDAKMVEIETKNRLIAGLEFDLEEMNKEFHELETKFEMATATGGRTQKLSAQHDEIQVLLKTCASQTTEIERLTWENRRLAQTVAIKGDHLKAMDSELTHARALYERDVLRMLPDVEQHVHLLESEHQAVLSLRNDLTLGVGRASLTDKKLREAQVEIVDLKAEVDRVARLYVSIGIICRVCFNRYCFCPS